MRRARSCCSLLPALSSQSIQPTSRQKQLVQYFLNFNKLHRVSRYDPGRQFPHLWQMSFPALRALGSLIHRDTSTSGPQMVADKPTLLFKILLLIRSIIFECRLPKEKEGRGTQLDHVPAASPVHRPRQPTRCSRTRGAPVPSARIPSSLPFPPPLFSFPSSRLLSSHLPLLSSPPPLLSTAQLPGTPWRPASSRGVLFSSAGHVAPCLVLPLWSSRLPFRYYVRLLFSLFPIFIFSPSRWAGRGAVRASFSC